MAEGVMLEEVWSLCMRLQQDTMESEKHLLEMAQSFEVMRKRCLTAETELKSYKELLVKSDVAKAALDVKLKHARNQVDLELKKRLRLERDFQYLQRQMQLMCDILVQDSKSSSCLNDEQRSLLSAFETKAHTSTMHRSKRLSVIDESSFLSHSDISYDRTDEDVDLDSTAIKPLKSRARERRRSSMGVVSGSDGPMGKRLRTNMSTEIQTQVQDRKLLEKEVETIVRASVMTPPSTRIHMVLGISPKQDQQMTPAKTDQTSVWSHSEDTIEPETETRTEDFYRTTSSSSTFSNIIRTQNQTPTRTNQNQTPTRTNQNQTPIRTNPNQTPTRTNPNLVQTKQSPIKTGSKPGHNPPGGKHVFIPKTVIRPETCGGCGKRMRFGKVVVKCRCCRAVMHPECKNKSPTTCPGAAQAKPGSLESFCPSQRPRVPLLVVECIAEIERRGLKERGLYRVSGGDRAVKEIRDRSVSGKALSLGKVEDVHVVCGVLKDFLRRLPEPLITFRLHPLFMQVAEADNEKGAVLLYKAVSDLPPPNTDTLAFILLHLHKVMQSPECHMDHSNLSRVFGPTLIGHGLSEPSPSTIMRDTASQPKVMSRLLSIPADYWTKVLSQSELTPASAAPSLVTATPPALTNQDEGPSRLFQPLTSPELNSYRNRPGSISGILRNIGNNANGGRADPGHRFFTSPK